MCVNHFSFRCFILLSWKSKSSSYIAKTTSEGVSILSCHKKNIPEQQIKGEIERDEEE